MPQGTRRSAIIGPASVFVIPAPLASEARERDQAGTHAAANLLSRAGVRTLFVALGERIIEGPELGSRHRFQSEELADTCIGPGLVPLRALSGTRGAGMTKNRRGVCLYSTATARHVAPSRRRRSVSAG